MCIVVLWSKYFEKMVYEVVFCKIVLVGGKNDFYCLNSVMFLFDRLIIFGRIIFLDVSVCLMLKIVLLMIFCWYVIVFVLVGKWMIVDYEV